MRDPSSKERTPRAPVSAPGNRHPRPPASTLARPRLALLLVAGVMSLLPGASAFAGAPLMRLRASLSSRSSAFAARSTLFAPPRTLCGMRGSAPLSFARLLVSSAGGGDKKKLVFLGTPGVAASALQHLIDASKKSDAEFEVSAVVTNPPAPAGRKKVLTPSPVHKLAEESGIQVLTPTGLLKKHPDSAEFLEEMRGMAPDVCVTAAYGQFLPKSFLSIPPLGTLNIHPSLLPKFRGAAPVPRALEAGVDKTGVSVLFTVFEMDAGPVVGRRERALEGDEKADALLPELFDEGSELLLEVLGGVFEGKYKQDGTGCDVQNDEEATHADKMTKDEGELWFTENALYAHNRVRAFAGWPGTSAQFVVAPSDGSKPPETVKVKIITTRVSRPVGGAALGVHQVKMNDKGNAIVITCDDGSQLEVLELQPPGKKVMDAKSFWNGMRGKDVERKRVGWSTGKVPGQA